MAVDAKIKVLVILLVLFLFAISMGLFIYFFIYKKRKNERKLKRENSRKFPILQSPANLSRQLSFGEKKPMTHDIYIVRKQGVELPDIGESLSKWIGTRVICGNPPPQSPPPPPPLHLRYLEIKKGVILYTNSNSPVTTKQNNSIETIAIDIGPDAASQPPQIATQSPTKSAKSSQLEEIKEEDKELNELISTYPNYIVIYTMVNIMGPGEVVPITEVIRGDRDEEKNIGYGGLPPNVPSMILNVKESNLESTPDTTKAYLTSIIQKKK